MDHRLIPTIIDCDCGLRYMRSGEQTLTHEVGHQRCKCGEILGAWNGRYRLVFEGEEDDAPNTQH